MQHYLLTSHHIVSRIAAATIVQKKAGRTRDLPLQINQSLDLYSHDKIHQHTWKEA